MRATKGAIPREVGVPLLTALIAVVSLLGISAARAQDYWNPPALANRNATGTEYYMLEMPDSVAIDIDGYDSDWAWFDSTCVVTTGQWRDEGDRPLPSRTDLSITTKMAWKGAPENRWYVFMHIHDDMLSHGGTDIRRWSGDMLGFALDPQDHGRTRGEMGYSQEYLTAPGNLSGPNFIERHSSATGGTGPAAWQAYGQPPYLVGAVRVAPPEAWAADAWTSATGGDTYYEWSVAVWDKFEDNGPSASMARDLNAQAGEDGFGLPFVFWVEDGDPSLDNDMTVRGPEAVDRQYFAHAVLLRSGETAGQTASAPDTTAPDTTSSASTAPDTSATLPVQGLVAYYPLEGNAADSSGTGNHGKVVGEVGFVAGPVGQAIYFDGSSYVEAGADSMPSGDAARAIALWVRLDEVASEEAFFAGYGQFGTFDGAFLLGATYLGPKLSIFFSQWGGGIGCSACPEIPKVSSMVLGRWYHVAVTSAKGGTTLYIDGVQVDSSNPSINTVAKTSFYLGGLPGEVGATRHFTGALDEVRVYNRVLSAAEVQQLFSAGQVPPDTTAPGTTSSASTVPDTSAFRILSITDVPNDQGRQVQITWQRHPNDRAGASPQITQYSLWRRIDPDLPAVRPKPLASSFGTQPPGEWTFITTVPAKGVETYTTIAPTLADSTAASGVYYSVFYLTAHTQDPAVTSDCGPDSGYSVNDLKPAMPAAFTGMVYGGKVRLVWQPVALGVAYYVVYRGASSGFQAEQVHGLAVSAHWEEDYAPQERYYRLAVVGFTGERSLVTEAVEVKPWAGGETVPGDFDQDGRISLADFFLFADALGSTTVRYDLDGDGRVELDDFLLFADRFGLSSRP